MNASMARRHAVIILAVGFAAVVAGCEESRHIDLTGPTSSDGIVVESVRLEQDFEGFLERCEVHGTIRNDSGAGQRVTLVFEAFNGEGSVIGTAVATVGFVAAGRHANFGARVHNFSDDGFLNDCDKVARVELADVVT